MLKMRQHPEARENSQQMFKQYFFYFNPFVYDFWKNILSPKQLFLKQKNQLINPPPMTFSQHFEMECYATYMGGGQ